MFPSSDTFFISGPGELRNDVHIFSTQFLPRLTGNKLTTESQVGC